jgi:hypothetical protein
MVSVIGHLKNTAIKENYTLFTLVTSHYLELKDHFKLLSLSKKTTQLYLAHNSHAFFHTLHLYFNSFHLKFKDLQDSYQV